MIRNWLASVLLVGISVGCAMTKVTEPPVAPSEVDLSSMREIVLTVHGLSCPLCSNNVDGQLKKIKGVEDVSIDLKTGAVSVRLGKAHSVSPRDLARAVENAGFTLKSIEPRKAD